MLRLFVNVQQTLARLLRREEGATMVEYGLLVALIAVVAAVGAAALGTELSSFFSAIATWLAGKEPST
jgi:pilus assembly protein Flp/PilA